MIGFPIFKGGNQDPIEWLNAFERACEANQVARNRMVLLVASYLKGTALTWFNSQNITYWNAPTAPNTSFVPLFKNHFCNPFKISQWKHQLHNRKQKPGETVEEYTAAMGELWKRIDPANRRTELDRIHEFLEGLRPEFIIPVQTFQPTTVVQAIEKTGVVETAFSMEADLSAYSMLPGYLENMGGMISARMNIALYNQPSYAANYHAPTESIEQVVERKIKEEITAALGQLQLNSPRNNNNNISRNNNSNRCYLCNGIGHFARDCNQRSISRVRSNNAECYKCEKIGHIAHECKSLPRNNNQNNNQNRKNNDQWNKRNSGNNQFNRSLN